MNKILQSKKNFWLFLIPGIFLFSFNLGNNSGGTGTSENTTSITIQKKHKAVAVISPTYKDTAVSGKAFFTEKRNGNVYLKIKLHIPSKANKEVAVHIHEHGDCGNMGMNTHGHWNPTKDKHGKWGSSHFHLGDIGNVKLDSKGNGTLKMNTNLWNIGGDSDGNILGRAIIVHGGTDDYVTQPTGNAGGRIGCGVIQ